MKLVSIDIETTGTDPAVDKVLEITAIAYDSIMCETDYDKINFNNLPSFHRKIFYTVDQLKSVVNFKSEAYNMNKTSIDFLMNYGKADLDNLPNKYCTESQLGREFEEFLEYLDYNTQDVIVVGKNFANFDKRFLENIPEFTKYVNFSYRYLDPAIYYINLELDHKIPSLQTCIHRSAFMFENLKEDLLNYKVKHNSYDDDLITLKLLLLNFLKGRKHGNNSN